MPVANKDLEVREVEHLEDQLQSDSKCSTLNLDLGQTKSLERKLKLKLDFFILPMISCVYFFASMDRTDLGNAQVAGMQQELKLSNSAYSTAATTFLVGYIAFQLPGTLLLRIIGPNWQFGGAMLVWGLFTSLSVVIQNSATLLAFRFLIGSAEAFIQGTVFYLSFWYTYRELATRGAIFFSTSTLASGFSGLVSYAITKNLNGANGWLAWRWIFLIEGLLPIVFGILVMIFLPSTPQAAKFPFTPEEKQMAIERGARAHNQPEARLEWKKIPGVLTQIHFWLFTIMYCCTHYCLSSLGNFLPAIIKGFGYDSVHSQLMSVVVYACAFAGVLMWARIADKTNARGLTLAASNCVAVVGYALLIGLTGTKQRLAATCLLAFGLFANIVLILTWLTMNVAGYTRRGSALGLVNMAAQLFAIAGNQAYIDPPYYKIGNASALAMTAVCGILAVLTSFYLRHLNSRKLLDRSATRSVVEREQSIEELGEKHPGVKPHTCWVSGFGLIRNAPNTSNEE